MPRLHAPAWLPLVLCFALLSALSCRGADVSFPPEPQSPDRKGLSDAQFNEAWRKWNDAHLAWLSSLTVEQYQAWKQSQSRGHEDPESKKRFERMRRLPIPADGYDWRKEAGKLDAETIVQLEKDAVAFGDSVKQSFDPYLGGPVFITSDSLLNGFHVIFEDSFRQLELRKAAEMRGRFEKYLEWARTFADGKVLPIERAEPALKHLQRVLGPALVLLGTKIEIFDESLRPEILSQARKIKKADEVALPEWLGPVDQQSLIAIDYRRCRPVGFYSEGEALPDYFRALRWLQMVPFRASRDVEIDAILILGLAVKDAKVGAPDPFGSLGLSADLTMNDLVEALDNTYPRQRQNLDCSRGEVRTVLVSKFVRDRRYPINSDLRAKSTLGSLFDQLVFRVVPTIQTPDAELFQRLCDANLRPDGLSVAMLVGSDFAAKRLDESRRKVVQAEQSQLTPDFNWKSRSRGLFVHNEYLNVVNALFLPVPDDVPAFMKSEVWAAKNCQTALAGWAQLKHTYTLQAKVSACYFGITIAPPGFVEDNPEFFARANRLIERCQDFFAEAGCFEPLSEKGEADEGEMQAVFDGDALGLRERWTLLARQARSLETLAHKQARHLPWTREEEAFLKAYGEQMAAVMGYDGNSYLSPKDDAPRWAEVNRDTVRDLSLAVGVGRPRVIYVLYPWQGMEILCQGTVMQYYEYESPQRLTDAEWKQQLDSKDCPPIPGWLSGFAGEPAKPKAKH